MELPYYINYPGKFLDEIGNYKYVTFNENGIPVVDYSLIDMPASGIQYNPALVSLYAIGIMDRYISVKDDSCEAIFFKQVNFLRKTIKHKKNEMGIWEYRFDLPSWNQKSPWISALAQGFGLSAFSRAYLMTSDAIWLELMENVLNSFKYQIQNGGVCHTDKTGNKWFEEYPSEPPSHVLNGFIYALFGLLDFHKVAGNVDALRLFKDGISTLKQNITRYDTGYWSLYSLDSSDGGIISDVHYHRDIHVPQIKALYELTNEEIFKTVHARWQNYTDNPSSLLRRRLFHLPQRIVKKIYRCLHTRSN